MKSFYQWMVFTILCVLGAGELYAQDKSKIVFLHGGKSHACGDHEFKAGCHLLANHLNKQNAVPVNAIVISGWPKDEKVLDDAKAIVIYCDSTQVVRHGWAKMDALTKKGVGVMFMHYGVHPTIEQGEKYFMPWIGGYFRNQQSVNPFWLADIKAMPGHAVSRGVGEIKTVDEFYHSLKYSEKMIPLGVAIPDEKNLKFINNLWTEAGYQAKGKPQALLWGFERPDGGRGAGFTGGHHHHNWALDNYRRLVLNTILWIAKLEVPKEGIPIFKVTEDELNENLDKYPPNRTKRIKLPHPDRLNFKPGEWLSVKERHERRAQRRKKNNKKK